MNLVTKLLLISTLLLASSTTGFVVDRQPINTNKTDTVYTSSGHASNSTRWESLGSSAEAILRRTDPAGIENGVPIFLCRTLIPDSTVYRPGSLSDSNGNINCRITNGGNEYLGRVFQILEAPIGSTSWIPYNGVIPPNAIVGGTWAVGAEQYICRTFTTSYNLIVGNLGVNGEKCYVTVGGVEFGLDSDIEILVVNAYGSTFESK